MKLEEVVCQLLLQLQLYYQAISNNPLLNDSKKISEKGRDNLREVIEKEAYFWSVSRVNARQIEKINILNASIKAMHLSLNKLNTKVDLIIVDGNKFKNYKNIPHKCIIKGDQKI